MIRTLPHPRTRCGRMAAHGSAEDHEIALAPAAPVVGWRSSSSSSSRSRSTPPSGMRLSPVPGGPRARSSPSSLAGARHHVPGGPRAAARGSLLHAGSSPSPPPCDDGGVPLVAKLIGLGAVAAAVLFAALAALFTDPSCAETLVALPASATAILARRLMNGEVDTTNPGRRLVAVTALSTPRPSSSRGAHPPPIAGDERRSRGPCTSCSDSWRGCCPGSSR